MDDNQKKKKKKKKNKRKNSNGEDVTQTNENDSTDSLEESSIDSQGEGVIQVEPIDYFETKVPEKELKPEEIESKNTLYDLSGFKDKEWAA